jgi:Cft2 family RNA processing exonuclease
MIFPRNKYEENSIKMNKSIENIKEDPFLLLKNLVNQEKKKILNFEQIRKSQENIVIDSHPKYGKFIKLDDIIVAIDHWNPEADVIYISHAHMDHIPVFNKKIREKLKNENIRKWFLCSKISKEIAEERTRNHFTFPKSMWLLGEKLDKRNEIEIKGIRFKLIENGHTYGSTSLLLEGSERILYTSDFITQTRNFSNNTILKGLDVVECDRLITECTFGHPRFKFPSFLKIQTDVNNYISSELAQGNPVILLGYAFGKSQYLLNMLNLEKLDTKILLDRNIAKLTKILESNGIRFNEWEPYGNYNKTQLKKDRNYVLIIPNYSMFREPYKTLISHGAKLASFSGKVLMESFREKFPSDKYIAYSDHCDYNDLLYFIDRINSQDIFLEHGEIHRFFYKLHKYHKGITIRLF